MAAARRDAALATRPGPGWVDALTTDHSPLATSLSPRGYTPAVSTGLGPALITWYRHARRDLPWRGPFPRDPYHVLVSEVMLQQTQVERVREAYRRLVELFPSVAALARADEQDVLRAFSGLGYYRRARALHATARAVVAAGGWPGSRARLAALPGIGPYTSAALAAFSFAGSDPPVDGNVGRVAARLGALPLELGSRPLLAAGEALARRVFAETPTPEVWEALMELGATVCTPASPRCDACPWSASCTARLAGTATVYPLPRRKRATEAHRWVALWVEGTDGKVLLRRVDEGGLLAGLWLPRFESVGGDGVPADVARRLAEDAGVVGSLHELPAVSHSITHRRITVVPFALCPEAPCVREPGAGWGWYDPTAPEVPTSSLLAKLVASRERAKPRRQRRPTGGGAHA